MLDTATNCYANAPQYYFMSILPILFICPTCRLHSINVLCVVP